MLMMDERLPRNRVKMVPPKDYGSDAIYALEIQDLTDTQIKELRRYMITAPLDCEKETRSLAKAHLIVWHPECRLAVIGFWTEHVYPEIRGYLSELDGVLRIDIRHLSIPALDL